MSHHSVRLAEHTTLRVGGPAELVRTSAPDELIAAVRACDADATPVLLLGGGSNLVVSDDGFTGQVISIGHTGISIDNDGDDVLVRVAAGENWDTLVARTVSEGLSGLEAMAGIPGRSGATPIQNVGAYGAEVADVLRSVEVWDRTSEKRTELRAEDCGFGYRSSIFKYSHRYVVLAVTFRLKRDALSAPVQYAELAGTLGIDVADRAPTSDVREAVLSLRGAKGMVLQEDDHDTWSAGSFFTNPIVPPAAVPPGAPTYPTDSELVKTSAAWLIEHAGFAKGHGNERAGLSHKHTLAITNRGQATAADILDLARDIRDTVRGQFAIELQPEPLLIGCSL